MDAQTLKMCDAAMALVQQVRRDASVVQPLESETLKQCAAHITQLYEANVRDLHLLRTGQSGSGADSGPSFPMALDRNVATTIRIRQACADRIQRCCLAYIHGRQTLIKSLRWKHGGVLPNDIRAKLNEPEIAFFNEYCAALAEYQSSIGSTGANLMLASKPPKSLFVQVRARQDYGEFETSDGTLVHLKTDSIHSLPRNDCEMLIRQGVLEIVD